MRAMRTDDLLQLARQCRHYSGNVRCIQQARLARQLQAVRPRLSALRWHALVRRIESVLAEVLRHG